MLPDLTRLSSEELHDLFLTESHRFTVGMDDGLDFENLKLIRLNLRGITLELKSRKENGDKEK